MKEIDHNPNETRETNAIWWLLLAFQVFGWSIAIYYDKIDWVSAIAGVGSGAVLATWAIEITGNKTPESWRGKSRRS